MKRDHRPLDETRRWGKRESWIVESQRAPGHYETKVDAVKSNAPKVSFPKSGRFLSQKVNMTDQGHERELMAIDSPGPKYNVASLACNGGKVTRSGYSFATRAPETTPRLPHVNSPRRGHRESWLSNINRNGVLVMPASPGAPRAPPPSSPRATETATSTAKPDSSSHANGNTNSPMRRSGSVFGNEHRFGHRQRKHPGTDPAAPTSTESPSGASTSYLTGQRVQFVSASHTRENMGEFSPGPIYAPAPRVCPGGRLAPSSSSSPSPSSSASVSAPPGTPRSGQAHVGKNPDANLSSRSSWLAGNVRKSDGLETVLMRTGDVPPGPGAYGNPRSSFAAVSHNVKAQRVPTTRSPRRSPQVPRRPSPKQHSTRESALRPPEPTSAGT